jgi:hypothetical protein
MESQEERYELTLIVGGDVDIVAQTTKLGEQVVGNKKL